MKRRREEDGDNEEVLAGGVKGEAASGLEDLGFYFNNEGRLVSLATDAPFEFISPEHYDAVGAAVVRHIQKQMTTSTSSSSSSDRSDSALLEIWLPTYEAEDEWRALARLASAPEHDEEGGQQQHHHQQGRKRPREREPEACRYGLDCFRANEKHRRELWHPPSECRALREQVRCNVFVSPPEVMAAADRLLVFICGMGPVRAGQWARKLCMFDSLQTGSILPYLARARDEGYAVVVLNPNYNEAVVKRTVAIDNKKAEPTKAKPATSARGHKRRRQNSDDDDDAEEEEQEEVEYEDKVSIPFNENGFRHIAHVWDRLITPTRFGIKGTGKVAIVAHSFGGNHALSIMQDRRRDLFSASARARRSSSIHAVAFIDSVHTIDDKTPPHVTRLLRTRARHWVKSQQPLDAPLDRRGDVDDADDEGEDRPGKRTKKKTMTKKDEEEEEEQDTTHADGCERVSAGSDSHDHCPSACIDSVFGWLAQQLG